MMATHQQINTNNREKELKALLKRLERNKHINPMVYREFIKYISFLIVEQKLNPPYNEDNF